MMCDKMADNHSLHSDDKRNSLTQIPKNSDHNTAQITVNEISNESSLDDPGLPGGQTSGSDFQVNKLQNKNADESLTEGSLQKLSADCKQHSTNDNPSINKPNDGHHYKTAAEELKATYGYEFQTDGRLFNRFIGEPFQFEVSLDKRENEETCEKIGELVDKCVFQLLEKDAESGDKYACGLVAMGVPEDDENGSCIFVSKNFLFVNCDKLLVLIHGTGVVRAGQWSRRLTMNESLDHGTQIPYIKRWMTKGPEYGVLVMNTNDRTQEIRSPDAHGRYVWKHYVRLCKAKKIAIVAHSAGGVVVTKIISEFIEDFKERVHAIAFTDSVHDSYSVKNSSYFNKVACNWVCSNLPLNTFLHRAGRDCELRSAGTGVHRETSYKAIKSVFEFIEEQFGKRWDRQEPKKQNLSAKVKSFFS